MITFVLLLSLSTLNLVENSGIYTLMQYFECQNLKMIPNSQQVYVPNPNISNNTLNDNFYKTKLGLLNMTFDQAMGLMRRIYNETNQNRSSEFSRCTRTRYANSNIDFSGLFVRNETIFLQTKRIVLDFINKFKGLYDNNSKERAANYIRRSDMPTLVEFFIRNEFSLPRIDLFNSSVIDREFPGYTSKQRSREVIIYFLYFFSFII